MAYSRDEILAAIRRMSVLDLADLVRELQETFGVATPPAGVLPPPPIIDDADRDPRPTAFDVILTAAGAQKIQVIKAVREVTTLGLKEAKDLVDGVPNPVKEGVGEAEAAALQEKLEAAGAAVEIRPA